MGHHMSMMDLHGATALKKDTTSITVQVQVQIELQVQVQVQVMTLENLTAPANREVNRGMKRTMSPTVDDLIVSYRVDLLACKTPPPKKKKKKKTPDFFKPLW
mmetsp:Transcript_10667/g.15861  ORF Transcript_10667/g.15861 Transcript_10667/m.15861 type:complete len:103 (-) Transcript_10667:216-524(-)